MAMRSKTSTYGRSVATVGSSETRRGLVARWSPLLVLGLLLAPVLSIDAQVPQSKPGVKVGLGAVTPGTSQPPVAGIDLLPIQIGLNGNNHVSYTMLNNGHTAVSQPFVADILLNGVRRDTYKHAPLAALARVTVTSPLAEVDSCDAVVIMVVADAQQIIAEANETNNRSAATLAPRCPDLVVTEIKPDWQDLNTRFRIQVTVKNQGDKAMPRKVIARAWGGPGGDLLTGLDAAAWPILQDTEIGPLQPGESTTFHLGGTYLGTDQVDVKVYPDFYHQIVEKRVDNNMGSKHFGPH